MSSPSKHVTQWLIVFRWPLLLAGVVAACVAWPMAGQLSFDRSIENMFAEDDPILEPFRQLRRTFGGNEVVMAVYVDDELLQENHRGIRRLAVIARELEQVEGVAAVLSLDRLLVVDPKVESLDKREYLDIDGRLGLAAIELFEGYTHGADGETVSVACMLVPEAQAKVTRRETIDAMREIMEEKVTSEEIKLEPLDKGMLSGEPVMVTDGFRYIEEDGQRLGWWSTIVLSVTIWLCFRSVRWVLIPVAVVQLTLLLTKALLAWWGLQMTMVSSMLTAIVTVVGIATVMHVIVRFRDARHDGLTPRPALAHAGGLIAAAIFWACATDAAGFASLLVAQVEPVQDFGLMMALGSLLVVVSVVLVLPGLTLLGRNALRKFAKRFSSAIPGFAVLSHIADDPRHMLGEGLMQARLGWLVQSAEKRPALVAAVLLLLGAAITAGTTRLTVESDFTRNFRQNSPVVKSYIFVEDNLGGAGVWDIVVPAPDHLDWEYLKRVLKLEDRLRKEVLITGPDSLEGESQQGLTKVISLADMVVASSPTDLDSTMGFFRRTMVRVSLKKMRERLPAFYDALYGEDPAERQYWDDASTAHADGNMTDEEVAALLELQQRLGLTEARSQAILDTIVAGVDEPRTHYMRIMLRSRERQPAEQKRSLIRQVTKIVSEEFPPTGPEAATPIDEKQTPPADADVSAPPVESPGGKVTGYFVLLSQLIESMVRDQWTTFAVACIGITVMMLLAVRDVRLALIALVPNALPILVVMGMMGWLGLKINMGVAMIAAVSLGLSIDSSIHYLTSFQRARRSGKSVRDSLADVQQTVGRAMVFSTLALIVGFSVLLTSNFIPTVWFGGLVSVAMLGGLAGNLFVLPVLVTLVMPSK